MAKTKKIVISQEIREMEPYWKKFITDLGYTKKQAEAFAEGYGNKVKRLPTLEKMEALYNKYDSCMTAGFKKAGIDEDEAFNKAKKKGLA